MMRHPPGQWILRNICLPHYPMDMARFPISRILGSLLLLGCGGSTAVIDADLVIRGTTLVLPEDGSLVEDQAVIIADGLILSVGMNDDVSVSPDARVVDAEGLYLMPGMWDLHTHLSFADDNAAPLMITQGVTGARDMGAVPAEIEAIKSRIDRGEALGPRVVRVGPTLNGADFGPHQRVIGNPADVRAAVAELEALGVDAIKTHNATGRDEYFALLDAAAAAGLEVVGHVPMEVSPLEACEGGQGSIDHIVTIFEGVYMARFDSEMESFQGMASWLTDEAPTLIACFVEKGTLFVPTLRTYEFRANRAALYESPPDGWDYLTEASRAQYREQSIPSETDRNAQVIAVRMSLVEIGQRFTQMVNEAGGAIGTGSDFAGPGVVPGFSIRREVELLVAGGLPNHAALWAATRGPGTATGASPQTGRIESGAPADLVLLRSNPFADLGALREVEGVGVRGRWLDRAELDRTLSDLAAN